MNDIFVKKIHIEKLRYLENVTIDISSDEKKHLILTGKNGSGKTTLLDSLRLEYSPHYYGANHIWTADFGTFNDCHLINNEHVKLKVFYGLLDVDATYPFDCMTIFFGAYRKLKLHVPSTIETVDVENRNISVDDFLKYLVLLNYQKLDALANDNLMKANEIKNWFNMLEGVLREIFNTNDLTLVHNSKDLTFKVAIPGREPFGFNEMADGYSTFLDIVFSIMMKMESKASMTYDMPGIVFIDEIEAHLHVELQRLILPFLVKMFPRIQFIVTTHSPFIISSLRNAVVFDLERQIRVEDMSNYSYEAVIEHYYDLNQYSKEANRQFEIYRTLLDKADRTPDESEAFINARTYLRQVPAGAAQELVNEFNRMEAKRKDIAANG